MISPTAASSWRYSSIIGALALTLQPFYAASVEARQNFVKVRLPHAVAVELPRNWVAVSNNQRIMLDTAVQAMAERQGYFDATSDVAFAANFYDDAGRTGGIFNIRYYPEITIGQTEARAASIADVQELDKVLHRELETAFSGAGLALLQWRGTVKQVLNGKTVFVTDYRRASLSRGTRFRVRLVRVFNGDKSFTITISYREDLEIFLRPICDRVIGSLRF